MSTDDSSASYSHTSTYGVTVPGGVVVVAMCRNFPCRLTVAAVLLTVALSGAAYAVPPYGVGGFVQADGPNDSRRDFLGQVPFGALSTEASGTSSDVNGNTGTWVASAAWTADLGTGYLRATAGSSGFIPPGANFQAYLYDVLYLSIAGADAHTVTRIPAVYELDGTLTGIGQIYGDFAIGEAISGEVSAALDLSGLVTPFSTGTLIDGDGECCGSNTAVTWPGTSSIPGYFEVIGGHATVPLYSILGGFGWDGTTAFGNTAKFSIDFPTNVTFTSASGVLLTGPTEVNEPSGLILCMIGLACLAVPCFRLGSTRTNFKSA